MAIFLAFCITAVCAGPAFAQRLGSTVENVATVTFDNGLGPATLTTPPASFVLEALRTPSDIEFFRITTTAPDQIQVNLNGSEFAPSGSNVFVDVGGITTTTGQAINTASPVGLVQANDYFPGEPIVVRVIDEGQNGDSSLIETLVATIETDNGDIIRLRLFESGPNTGEFFAYVQSVSGGVDPNDNHLTIETGLTITTRYQDPFDASEVSTDIAGVDPFGRLFNSATGEFLDGISVTIVDAVTGAPAQVFGADGVSAYPSTIFTGQTVTDASGFVYDLGPGEFRFPIMFPGEYRLEIVTPDGFTAPSLESELALQTLPSAPFTILPASFGASFTLDGTGDVSFDVPLDPQTDIVVFKTALSQTAAVGDFTRYEVVFENRGSNATRLRVRDTLPRGVRYQRGSARENSEAIDEPQISDNGRELLFIGDIVPAGGSARLTYVVEFGPGVEEGTVVNLVRAVDGQGNAISNTAEAAIEIRDDFLRQNTTIVGRIALEACNPNDKWPRDIQTGEGVEGVRLYLETGAYVVTDEDGLYHFEDITPGTHVVQVDESTLPLGTELVRCEDNTRFAGSVSSQFVDVQGGAVWRGNFYLRKTDAYVEPVSVVPSEEDDDLIEYKRYDLTWLDKQTIENQWAYPAAGSSLPAKSVNLGFRHDVKTRVTLLLNDRKVSGLNFAGREVSSNRKLALTRWRGVDLLDGENVFTAIITDLDGNELTRMTRTLYYINRVERVEYLPEQSVLVADGRSEPVIAVRTTDGAGRAVRAGRDVPVVIDAPYRAADRERLEDTLPIDTPLTANAAFPIDDDGVLRVRLAPTTNTGIARVVVKLDNGLEEEFTVYLKPELRDWIVVGVAEGELARTKTELNSGATPSATDTLTDGRVAVFAKGTVKGDWLVTVAGDTAKGRGREDDELFDTVNPDDRYPLYGDRTDQEFEAQSRYPIYLKAEKEKFQALIGDFDTGLSESQLSRYSRRLTGAKATYEGDRVKFNAFASDTNQTFVRDELAADGTSGPFRLTETPLVRNSETIIIETRDRFRPDIIVDTTPLSRFADYDIDYTTGEIIFRLPIPATDNNFNNNAIVVDYETSRPVERGVTTGGRAAVAVLGGKAEIGASLIHESGVGEATRSADLAGVDLQVGLNEGTDLRVEYAATRRDTEAGRKNDDAVFVEVDHVSENVQAKLVYQAIGQRFGLGQQTSTISGIRRYGGEVSYRFDEFTNEAATRRGARFVDAKAYREESLATGATRTLAEVAVREEGSNRTGSVGLRYVDEETADNQDRTSVLATFSGSQRIEKLGLNLRASRDQPLGENESTLFPARTTVGFDQRLFNAVTLNVSHEVQEGDNVRNANTIVGVTATPWTGGSVNVSADRLTQDSGQRIGATLGVDQQVRISEKWSASFGVTRREDLKEDGVVQPIVDIVPDAPQSPFDTDEAFTSVYSGVGYRSEKSQGSARFELRKSSEGQRYTGVAGAAREVSERLSFAGAARYTQENNDTRADQRSGEARLGAAWRPRNSDGLIVFNRLDFKLDEADTQDGFERNSRVVNNLALNALATKRTQLSVHHGIKYSRLQSGGASFGGVTQLVGVEARHDIRPWLDIGVQGSALYSHNSRTVEYSYGPSIGVSPADNVWFTVGWNMQGFEDPDFAASEWSRSGPFVRLRIKFDQNTARGLLDKISPDRSP